MFRILIAVLALLTSLGCFYVVRRSRRFSFIQKIAGKNRALAWALRFAPAVACLLFLFVNVNAVIIAQVHLILFWALADLAAWIVKKIRKKEARRYWAGAGAILFTAVYLGVGWFLAHHVFRTAYTFETQKDLGRENLRVVLIADSHIGATLDGEEFAEEMRRVAEEKPDLVVIAGDFVDDDTEKDDMLRACEALGELKPTFGVYLVFGNHDRGYFNTRNFSAADLRDALTANGVGILEDEAVLIDGAFYLVGRRDRSERDRLDAETLTRDLDREKYAILLDHQPNDYANEAGKADLVLSGHTHGGHIFPAGIIGEALGANDRTYGTEVRGGTDFLVTSGISGWGIPFKTFCLSEYVVIDIHSQTLP